jgi:hypothetical protein
VINGGVAAFSIEGDGATRVVVLGETRVRDKQLRAEMIRQIRSRCHDAFLFGPDNIVPRCARIHSQKLPAERFAGESADVHNLPEGIRRACAPNSI